LTASERHTYANRTFRKYDHKRDRPCHAPKQGWHGCLITNTAVELAPHDPQAAAHVQAYVVRREEAFYRALLQAQPTGQLAVSSSCRDLVRFRTGSALGLGVLANTLPGRQALDGYAAVVLSVLA
jgi:TetR/AcrR family transcriptional regulator, transcriptional repressor for nem operon